MDTPPKPKRKPPKRYKPTFEYDESAYSIVYSDAETEDPRFSAAVCRLGSAVVMRCDDFEANLGTIVLLAPEDAKRFANYILRCAQAAMNHETKNQPASPNLFKITRMQPHGERMKAK